MITKKSKVPKKQSVWPFTPDPSPHLIPVTLNSEVEEELIMSASQTSRPRPISVSSPREGIMSPTPRPTLEDVLTSRAPAPYTLDAFTAFLLEQHCLETLDFTLEAKRYAEKYDEACAHLAGMPLNVDTDEGFELQQDWLRILDVYVRPGAPREINLPSEERDDLIDLPYGVRPPYPDALQPAVKRMHDLMSDSIFIPFCNSLRTVHAAQTYSALSEHAEHSLHPSRMTYDDRAHQRKPSRRRTSPPPSTTFQPSRSPPSQNRPPQTSSLTSGLARTTGNRISTYKSNTSAVSAAESAITDDSTSGDSPLPSEQDVLSPPITPPAGELSSHPRSSQYLSASIPKPHRSESGGWKKMGQKIWGSKKKPGTGLFREQDDASQ